MSAAADSCRKPGCKVAETGECDLKHDPVESCPNYGPEHNELDPEDLSPEASSKPQPVPIVSSEVMHGDDLDLFMRQRPIVAVALIGEQRAGKTTLLASIFGLFCKGPFASFKFVESRTLVGFAKRHHLALLNSGRTVPVVPRTSRDDPVAFFHLALQAETGEITDLIISDRSGETYGAARTDTSLIPTLTELNITKRVCFLLDGGKLTQKDKRPSYVRHFKQMIHALHDNGALKAVDAVEVLTTKFDITNSSADHEQQTQFLDEYEKQLVAEFAERGLAVTCHRICALPKADQTVGFVGLDALVSRWTKKAPHPAIPVTTNPVADRQFDRLLARTDAGD